jgi:hypothetical protein
MTLARSSAMRQTQVLPFYNLQGYQFMRLTTFRKNGEPVSTTVWFAQDGEKLYVLTPADAGKVRRIRNNAQVEVAPCSASGRLLGVTVEAMARILPGDEAPHAIKALNRKYGFQKRVFDFFHMVQGVNRAYLEIMPM